MGAAADALDPEGGELVTGGCCPWCRCRSILRGGEEQLVAQSCIIGPVY